MLLRAKTQRELEWGASGCWIAHYIYYEGCVRLSIGLRTVHDIIVELGARLLTSRVVACTARDTGLGYHRIRCADKILPTIRQDVT